MGELSNIGLQFIQKFSADLNSGKLELPAFPDIAQRVKNALEADNVCADNIAGIVSSEPVLTARLLKVANSVMMNPAGAEINDVRSAITRLGFDMVHNTAVSIALEQLTLSGSIKHLKSEMEAVWKHSVNIAAMSYVIARKLTSINADKAMMVGLLHNIGKVYILTRLEHDFSEIILDQPQLIQDLLTQWHSGVGSSILEAWNFSEEICTAVNEYVETERKHFGDPDLADIVLVANLLDDIENTEIDLTTIPAIERLGLSPEVSLTIIEESKEKVQSIMLALGG